MFTSGVTLQRTSHQSPATAQEEREVAAVDDCKLSYHGRHCIEFPYKSRVLWFARLNNYFLISGLIESMSGNRQVLLTGGGPWGVTLNGGKDFCSPLIVSKVKMHVIQAWIGPLYVFLSGGILNGA